MEWGRHLSQVFYHPPAPYNEILWVSSVIRMQLEEIHINSCEILTKFVRISCEFHVCEYSGNVKFVRNSYEFRTDFT